MIEKNLLGKDLHSKVLELLSTNNFPQAERLCDLIIKADREDYRAWFLSGVSKQFQGRIKEALESFNKAASLNPIDLEIMNAQASCYGQLERYQDAYEILSRAYALSPDSVGINANLGVACEKLGNYELGLRHYDQALGLDPENRIALLNRGSLLTRMGRPTEGLAHARNAYRVCPELSGTLYNLVDALIGAFMYEEALTYCEQGLMLEPRHAHLMFKKGMILSCLRDFAKAQQILSQAQVLQPGILRDLIPQLRKAGAMSIYADTKTLYFEAMYQEQMRCYWKHRHQYLNELNNSILEPAAAYQTLRHREFGFQIFSLEIDASTRLKLMRAVSEHVMDIAWLKAVPPLNYLRHAGKRIKIGYVSPDFRQHPVGLLSQDIYALHNRQCFEVVAYSLHTANNDVIQQNIKHSCDAFHDLSELTPQDAARKIHGDGIDILVDLAGYTTYSNTEIFAFRPAPVQVAYLGFPGTMGADFIDYAVLDHTICPDDLIRHWHEQPLRLPHSNLVYGMKIPNDAHRNPRAHYNLPELGFVFCCMNTIYKLEPDIFGLWMRILKKVEGSILWLAPTDEFVMENLRAEAGKHRIEPERLVFADFMSYEEHWPRYQSADIFLDTFWHNAHTTAADALWQGLPVLTYPGEVASSRLAASLLNALEMPELICNNLQEYEERAVYYATHPEALAALKERLGIKRHAAPLFDTPRTVRALERGYKMIWQRYLDRLPPVAIDVPDDMETVN